MISRRNLLRTSVAASAAILARARMVAAQASPHGGHGGHGPGHGSASKIAVPVGPAKLTTGRAVAGESYTPVVMPNGSHACRSRRRAASRCSTSIAEPVKHEIAPGLEIEAWGYNGCTPGPADRVRRGRPRPHLRHQQAARADQRALARRHPAERHGRRRRPDPAADPRRRDLPLRVHDAARGHVHVPPALRRDDADRARHGRDDRRAPEAAATVAASATTR